MSVKMKLNKKDLTNKILGCWIGKNIGGTMGAPYEGMQQLNDISGFNSPKGEPLPNDDLDLQLVWLKAMQEVGPKFLTANVLADYWVSHISPHWNEYGIGKANIALGLLPPLSGEYKNFWKNSNGAWIRSEIWACLAPGVPDVAVKYAIMDASIDHGLSEGTYAEIFTASLESMAFFESNLRVLIDKALAYIPKDCRVARSIKIVLDSYDKGISWQEARELILKDSADLGWFQAPGNVAFTVLGLIYGEGDFKKSLIYAINCGDDTDCTGATCGAVLGIIMGVDNIPADWREYIGDRIMSICINGDYVGRCPKTCTNLTERVLDTLPVVLNAYGIEVEFTDAISDLSEVLGTNLKEIDTLIDLKDYFNRIFARSPYSFEMPRITHTKAIVEYETEPYITPNSDFKVKIKLEKYTMDVFHFEFNVSLPEGWSAEYPKNVLNYGSKCWEEIADWEMTIHVGEKVDAINKIPVIIIPKGYATSILVPITLLG